MGIYGVIGMVAHVHLVDPPPLGPMARRRFDIFSFSFLYFRRRDRLLLLREMNEFGHLQHHTPAFPTPSTPYVSD